MVFRQPTAGGIFRLTTSRHRRYSELVGDEVVVEVTPLPDYVDDRGRTGARIVVKRGRTTLWAPEEPLLLGILDDVFTRAGRIEAANAALDFFEAELREDAHARR